MLTTLFAQKESESIATADGFDDMAKQSTDMAVYLNSSSQPANPIIGLTKLSDFTKGSYAVATVDFENGKVACTITSHGSQVMADLLKKYPMRTIDINLLDKYPSQIEAFIISSFDPQLLSATLQYMGVDALINSGMQQMGINLTITDIFKAFKGDFVLVGSDLGTQSKTVTSYGNYKLAQPVTTNVPTYKFLANVTIDKPAYSLVASALAQKGMMAENNGQYIIPNLSSLGFAMGTTDKNLYIASSADLIQQYEAGNAGKSNLPAEIHDKIKDKVFAMYIDVNKIISAIPEPTNEKASFDDAKATFKDFLITMDKTNDNISNANMDIRLMNGNENSLVTFLRYAIAEKKNENKRKMNMPGMGSMTDSTGMPPPPAK
jgi:hypothetical protein